MAGVVMSGLEQEAFPDPRRGRNLRQSEEEQLADEIARRGKAYVPRAKNIKSVIRDWTIRRNIAAERESAIATQEWVDAVGEQIAPYTRPGNVRRGTLHVWVDSPLVVQELTLRQKQIIARLQTRLPDHRIERLRFHVQ